MSLFEKLARKIRALMGRKPLILKSIRNQNVGPRVRRHNEPWLRPYVTTAGSGRMLMIDPANIRINKPIGSWWEESCLDEAAIGPWQAMESWGFQYREHTKPFHEEWEVVTNTKHPTIEGIEAAAKTLGDNKVVTLQDYVKRKRG